MKWIKQLYESEKIRYLFIGGMTTLVNLVIFHLLVDVLHRNVTASNVVSIIAAILFAFFANKIVVFRAKSSGVKAVFAELIKFFGGRAVTMVIEVGGVYLLYNILGIKAMIAKVATQVIVVILNYFISKYFVFSQK